VRLDKKRNETTKQQNNKTPMNQLTVKRTNFRRCSLALTLAAALLTPLAAVQADCLSFNLFGRPVAVNINSPGHESIAMTGAGIVCSDGTVQASGAYELFNAFDHPNGPIVRGTWYATGVESVEDGIVVLDILATDNAGGGSGTGTLVLMEEGISGFIYAGETYASVTELGGGVKFHIE
jgi:hypothetical protein